MDTNIIPTNPIVLKRVVLDNDGHAIAIVVTRQNGDRAWAPLHQDTTVEVEGT
jgi:hypothetical protein